MGRQSVAQTHETSLFPSRGSFAPSHPQVVQNAAVWAPERFIPVQDSHSNLQSSLWQPSAGLCELRTLHSSLQAHEYLVFSRKNRGQVEVTLAGRIPKWSKSQPFGHPNASFQCRILTQTCKVAFWQPSAGLCVLRTLHWSLQAHEYSLFPGKNRGTVEEPLAGRIPKGSKTQPFGHPEA